MHDPLQLKGPAQPRHHHYTKSTVLVQDSMLSQEVNVIHRTRMVAISVNRRFYDRHRPGVPRPQGLTNTLGSRDDMRISRDPEGSVHVIMCHHDWRTPAQVWA